MIERPAPLAADRLVFFGDAVVAIAITLLVLPLAFVAVLLMPQPTFSVLWVLAVEPVVDIVWGRSRRARA